MGLLDDAIREHLELKRRRGADPSEVERLEHEALGPVRRSPHDGTDALMDEEGHPSGGGAVQEGELGWPDAPADAIPGEEGSEDAWEETASPRWPEAGPPGEFEEPGVVKQDRGPGEDEGRGIGLPRHHEIAEEWAAHERQGLTGQPPGIEPGSTEPLPPPPPASAGRVPGDERERSLPPDFEEETAEYQVEAEERGRAETAEPSASDDMLEETPDFLQDTPDHDRLWFEQRPPRDFDFDG